MGEDIIEVLKWYFYGEFPYTMQRCGMMANHLKGHLEEKGFCIIPLDDLGFYMDGKGTPQNEPE